MVVGVSAGSGSGRAGSTDALIILLPDIKQTIHSLTKKKAKRNKKRREEV